MVTMYNIRNGEIRWQISTSIKVILEHFFLAFTVFQKLNIIRFPDILWHWKYRSRSRCTTFAMAPFDGKYLTSRLMVIVGFALSLTTCDIFSKIIKCQTFWPWKWRSRSRGRRTGLVPFDWKCSIPHRWFFSEFDQAGSMFMQTGYTHTQIRTRTHTHTHTARDRGDDYRNNLQSRCA